MGSPLTFIIGIAVFAVTLAILNKLFADRRAKYKKRSLESIARDADFSAAAASDFIDEDEDRFGESMMGTPIIGGIYLKLKRGGSSLSLIAYLSILLVVLLVATYIASRFFHGKLLFSLPVGFLVMLIFNNIYLGRRLEKRNEQFLFDFPDAIDMIVRSIRSGHPLLSSLRLIAENARPPLSNEFQRVIDEVAYGRPMSEALRKMADRIGILDVNFFVVILSVQQETGGSMAEVLSNLSTIIRKRKQLRLKIRALTSEGRITTWMFSAIPFVQMGAIYFIKPDYLDPLFETNSGIICLLFSISLIALAIYIARQLCKMDI